jgi:hypothetical protein
MPEEIRHPDGRIEHPTVRYERSDASFLGTFFILLGALVFGVILLAAVLQFFYRYRDYQARIKQSSFPLAGSPSRPLPPPPRLEQIDRLAGIETSNVYDRESARLEVLDSYGPTSDAGFVHVPIERAIEALLERKTLKSRPEAPADQRRHSNGLVDAGESNAGRLFKGDPR